MSANVTANSANVSAHASANAGAHAAANAGAVAASIAQPNTGAHAVALGRAAASTGASGLLVRSTAVHQAHNVILFPPLGGSDRLNIIEGDALARLTVGKKP